MLKYCPFGNLFIEPKEYLLVDMTRKKLDVLFNYTFDEDCPWKHIPVRILPPACLPLAISHKVSSAYQITGASEWILKGSMKAGVDISMPHLRTICRQLNVTLPGKLCGSGKNGALKKRDFVRSLIQHVFPGCSDDFFKDIYALMLNLKSANIDLNVLAMVSELDCENQEAFKKLKEHAMQELEAQVFGKGKLAGLEAAASSVDEEKKLQCLQS